MASIFITGSADGLGHLAAKSLIEQGHQVTLHARSDARAQQALAALPGAHNALTGDLSSIAETKLLAAKANEAGRFDAVIHNAGIYQVPAGALSPDGLDMLLAVNTLAPYLLTALMHPPKRLVYLSSDMHLQGSADLDKLRKSKNGSVTYSDTKLHDLILAMAVARKWPDVLTNAIHPGWVPTKMGGPGATDDLQGGYETQTWLAVSDDPAAHVSGRYFHHRQPTRYLPVADEVAVQDAFLAECEALTGVAFRGQ